MELVKHIKAINEKSKKKMDANPDLWIGMLVEEKLAVKLLRVVMIIRNPLNWILRI